VVARDFPIELGVLLLTDSLGAQTHGHRITSRSFAGIFANSHTGLAASATRRRDSRGDSCERQEKQKTVYG